MSEMDEITQHASRFSAQLTQALGQLSQATGWLERRTMRKRIRKMVTDEQRQREQMRQAELAGVAKAMETYRLHSISTTSRALDPNVAPQQRERDRAAMIRHYSDLEDRVLRSSALTTIEQGIALDGMAAATTFPEYRLGNVFGRAGRVKGVEALRYRAQVARAQAAAGIERRPAYVRPPSPQRRAGVSGYTTEQVDAIQAIRRSQATDRWGPLPQHRDAERQHAAQWASEVGLSPDEITREFNHSALNSQVAVQVNGRALNGSSAAYIGLHPNEPEAAAWARENFGDYAQDMREAIGEPHEVRVTATSRDSIEPLFHSEGHPGFVADELTEWRPGIDRIPVGVTLPGTVQMLPREQIAQYSPEQVEAVQEIRRLDYERSRAVAAGRTVPFGNEQRQAAADRAARTGLSQDQITWEFDNAEANTRYHTRITSEYGGTRHDEPAGLHASETEAAAWAARKVQGTYWGPGVQVSATTTDRDSGRGYYSIQGDPEHVTDELAQWSEKATKWRDQPAVVQDRPTTPAPRREFAEHTEDTTRELEREVSESDRVSAPDARLVELERQVRELKGVAGERDQLAQKVAMLGRGVDAITADRDENKRQAEAARAEVQTLKNVTTRQEAELKDLRAQSLRLIEVTAEKNRLKSERDEAVAKVRAQARAQAQAATDGHPQAGRQQHNGSTTGASRQASPVEAGEQMQRAFNDQVRREFPGAADEVIERARRQQADMIGAIDDADSAVMRNKVAQLWQEHGAEATPEYAQAFQEWWSRGGDLEYAKERDRRARQRSNPAAGNGENTQAHQRETFSAPAESNGNWQHRPGRGPIERSR